MKLITLTISCLILSICNLSAQFARFPVSGVIEFEKKVNMHAVIRKAINKDNESYFNPMFEQYKTTQPQFKTSRSTLFFSKEKTYFSPIENTETAPFSWLPAGQQFNTIYNDLSTNTSSIQKKVFEETFLVKDSIRQIRWKITDETREIAGYPCRRANAIIMDSIYVVAFYTDQIPVSGGPETFSGLPGMILGVALPHENITWFATSVSDKPLEKPLISPTKGKAINTMDLRKTLESSLKPHGDYLKIALKFFLL